MTFKPDLAIGDVLNNRQISALFGCSIEGGIRKSNRNNCLVLVVNYTKKHHNDHWQGDTLYFTGHGDNPEDWQNRALAQSTENGMSIFLFEMQKQGEYIYSGMVHVVGGPQLEIIDNSEGGKRKAVIFKLQKLAQV